MNERRQNSRICGGLAGALFCIAAGLQAGVNDGLVAHYAFESANNLGADSSGNNRGLEDGVQGEVSSTEGVKGRGLALDGFSHLETEQGAAFATGSSFSWSIWFLLNEDDEESGALLSKSPEGWLPGSKAVFKNEDSRIAFDLGFVGDIVFEGNLQDGQWHNAVVVGNIPEFWIPENEPLASFEFYVDGNFVDSLETALENVAEPKGSIFRIGSGSPGSDEEEDVDRFPDPHRFLGSLDEVRIYDRPLAFPNEIVEIIADAFDGQLPSPEIHRHPQSAQGIQGRSLALSAEVSGFALEYQWMKDDQPVPDADSPVLFIEEVTAQSAGEYKLRVSNSSTSVDSNAATVTVLEEWNPSIGLAGYWNFETDGDLGKDASGNGVDLEDFGALSADGSKGKGIETGAGAYLRDTEENLSLDTLGDFTWTAMIRSENQGNIISKSDETWAEGNKSLFVRNGQLGFDTGWIGDAGGGLKLVDDAWHHVALVNQAVDGETRQTLYVDGNPVASSQLPFADQPDSGLFSIGYGSDNFPDVGDLGGQETPNYVGLIDEVRVYAQSLFQSDIVQLMQDAGGQIVAPRILQGPENVSIVAGRTARFRVVVAGTAPTYQWQKDGADIPGANAAQFSIPNVSEADAGQYTVRVSGLAEILLISEPAILTVLPAPVFAGGELAHVGHFLESYWNFDAAPNDVIEDFSPNDPQHDGVLANGAVLTTGNQGFKGTGEALDTSAQENAHMAAMRPEEYDFNESFTWSAWVKIDEPAGEGEEGGAGIFGRAPAETDHNNGSKVFYLNGDTLGFDTGWVASVNSSGPSLEPETWHHVAIVHNRDEGTVSIYLDGDPVANEEDGEPIEGFEFNVAEYREDQEFNGGFVNSGFRIGDGAIGFFAAPFPGLIDEAAVWSVALTAEDIALLADGASPLPEVVPPSPPTPGDATLSFSIESNMLILEFTGTLFSSATVIGGYSPVNGAQSPFVVDLSDTTGAQFYHAVLPSKSAPESFTQIFVAQALERYNSEGRDATIEYYNASKSIDGDWYVFIIEDDGIIAHAARPERLGKKLNELTDVTDYNYGLDFAATTDKGSWAEYIYLNPARDLYEKKHSWVVKHDGLIFGSGWYERTLSSLHPSRTEQPAAYTKALVEQAIRRYVITGRDAVIEYYNNRDTVDGQWYVYLWDADANILAHPTSPHLIGTNGNDLKPDVNGYYFGPDLAAAPPEGAWVTYTFLNPESGEQAKKHSWVQLYDGLIFGSGWYPSKDRPAQYTQSLVQEAIERYDRKGRDAVIEYYNNREIVDGQWYVFIMDENGISVAHPIRKDFIGTDRSQAKDVNGKPYGQELVAATEQGRWVIYVFENPSTKELQQKQTWVVKHNGLIFGSGWYEDTPDTAAE